jgi:hypothetical protein
MKYIEGFETLYSINESGEVIAHTRKVIMPNGGYKIIQEHKPKISITHKGYCKVMLTNSNGTRKGFFVHRLVMQTFSYKSKQQINHKDCNKKNNHISNLEYCTNRENTNHRFANIQKLSKYAGVTFHKRSNKWQAQKMINGKRTYLGLFHTEIEAYNKYINS